MRILVVRRDNIGDLVCTTPLFTALRQRFPEAWIGALVNSYNAPVLDRNPDIDRVYAYTKLKHMGPGGSLLSAVKARAMLLLELRRMRLDYVILANTDFVPRMLRFGRLLAPRKIAGFSDGSAAARRLDVAVPTGTLDAGHEVERVFAIARALGVEGEIPPLQVFADPAEVAKAAAGLPAAGGRKRIAVHISARRPAQRWSVENFVALIENLRAADSQVLLLWAPGAADDARHPGDDEKAQAIMQRVQGPDVVAYRTTRLPELIGALAACDLVVSSDGGTSHLAAALGKPIVCFFGDSSVERWRPWGVAQQLLRPESRRVADLGVWEVLEAVSALPA